MKTVRVETATDHGPWKARTVPADSNTAFWAAKALSIPYQGVTTHYRRPGRRHPRDVEQLELL